MNQLSHQLSADVQKALGQAHAYARELEIEHLRSTPRNAVQLRADQGFAMRQVVAESATAVCIAITELTNAVYDLRGNR